jgi:Fur family ferric uptake transcriptional regulator
LNWEHHLSAAGFRITQPRRAVMDVLTEARAPIAPQEIWERGRQTHPRLGLVTVYRTLALLEQLDCVRLVHRDDGCHAYLPCSGGHSHALICRRCGRAAEFPGSDDLRELVLRVEATTGYHIDDHLLQLSGLCPDCQQ